MASSLTKPTLYEFFTKRMGMSGPEATALVDEIEEVRKFATQSAMDAATLPAGTFAYAEDSGSLLISDGATKTIISSGGSVGPKYDQVITDAEDEDLLESGAFYAYEPAGAGESLTLPAHAGHLSVITVKNIGSFSIDIGRTGLSKIDDAATDYELSNGTVANFVSDGVSGWWSF